jgi:hypothetical protein
MELVKDPSVLYLVCKAKEIAEAASFGADPRPDLCLDMKPLPDSTAGL